MINFEPRDCPRCEGKGTHTDTWGSKETRECYNCNGKCLFYPPDFKLIMDQIKGRKGLRTSRPDRELGGRPYYVWRMARFHGGIDVTMPVMAGLELGSDPFTPELDLFADEVAHICFGTNMAAACRWGSLLTNVDTHTYAKDNNLPMTAFSSGPVVLGPKPASENPELY